MGWQNDIQTVLAAYPREFQTKRIEDLGPAGGFSGARFWRLRTAGGLLCLRRWPSEHPSREQLEYIHRVLRLVAGQGVDVVPVPLPDLHGCSYTRHAGHLWERKLP